MMKKLATLLLCILLLAAAHAEAPADTSAATTEYGWTLKIGRMAARGMPIQDLLNTLAAQDCPAVFAVGGWTGFMGAAPSEYAGYVMLLFPGEVRIMLNIKPDDDDENAEANRRAAGERVTARFFMASISAFVMSVSLAEMTEKACREMEREIGEALIQSELPENSLAYTAKTS